MIPINSSLFGFFFYIAELNRQHLATAVWLFAVGVVLGLLAVALLWALLLAVSPKLGGRCTQALKGPVLMPISVVMGIWVVLAFALVPMVPNSMEILNSLKQIPTTGESTTEIVVPVASGEVDKFGNVPAESLEITVLTDQLRKMTVDSTGKIELVARLQDTDEDVVAFDVSGGERFEWRRGDRGTLLRKIPAGETIDLYARNITNSDIQMDITIVTEPEHIEAESIFFIAALVFLIYGSYFAMVCVLPKMSAIAEATVRSEIYQLLFLICAVVGCLFMVASIYIPYQTFGEDIKVLKHTCLQAMMVLGIVVAVWAASRSVSEEIEGRTALTLLSKPVSRRQFVLGKFAGIAWLVSVLFIMISSVFVVAVAQKPIFDKREGATIEYEGEKGVTWQLLHHEAMSVTPGVLLVYMETLVLAGVSVAISTRLPMVANFMLTFGIWALGHLTPSIMEASVEGFEPVQFVASFVATILPVLKNFEIYGAISAGREIPMMYIAGAAMYTILYGALTMLLALILFEDRDLA
ncbi:ABC transporter permease [Bremerella sp. P1]|uniref:ABC transporter permease n=1 Tax=Bremerella sp. P1 TaxID=3026424 RepID=UPI00236756DB|nr:ABC transporter permease subunit [Bremerella sp. P1]WDI40893.1 ABC transporter permease [Bremerella sp. P1]